MDEKNANNSKILSASEPKQPVQSTNMKSLESKNRKQVRSAIASGISLVNHRLDRFNQNALSIKKYYKNQTPSDDLEFIDNIFPPNSNSLFGKKNNGEFYDPYPSRRASTFDSSGIVWYRAKDIFPGGNFALFEGKVEVDDINQGNLGDCYLLSAIASLSEYPELIMQIFRTTSVKENGCYEIAMYLNGEWNIVILDDYFPCRPGSPPTPIFCRPKGAEIWVMLIEKAWAKVNKGYTNIDGGYCTEVLSAMTGFPVESVYVKGFTHEDSKINEEQLNFLWEKIKTADSNGYIMTTSSSIEKENSESVGIVAGHAFSLISAHSGVVNGQNLRLLRIRNPWGYKEWCGDWSDSSPLWNEEAKEVFNYNENKEDGLFWMNFYDYVKYFEDTDFCNIYLPRVSISIKIPQERIDSFNDYELVIPDGKSVKVDISLIRKYYRFNRSIPPDEEVISNIIIVRKEEERDSNGNFLTFVSSQSSHETSMLVALILEPGTYLIHINANYSYGKSDKKRKYVLSISSNEYFQLYDRGIDIDCVLLKEMFFSYIKSNESTYCNSGEELIQIYAYFESTTYGFLYINNKSQNNYFIEGIEDSDNMFAITPYNGKAVIPSNKEWIIIGSRKLYNKSYSFSLNYTNKYTDSFSTDDCRNSEKVFELYSKKSYSFQLNYDYINTNQKFNLDDLVKNINIHDVIKQELLNKYPQIMMEISLLPSISDGKAVLRDKHDYGDGSFYIGEWHSDKSWIKHGRGYYRWGSGVVFIGTFENDVYSGLSKLIYLDGTIIEANYVKGIAEGEGTYTKNGQLSNVIFKDGKIVQWL